MGQTPIDAVLAGTKGFAVALFAPLTAKVGTRPRVAGDPGQILGLCHGPSALAVIEFTGEGSLGAVQALVRDGGGVRVVAGLPPAHAGAEGTLRALGVEVGSWDGKVDGVIAAVNRAVATMSGPVGADQAGAVPRPAPAAVPTPDARPPAPAGPRAPAATVPSAAAKPSVPAPPASAPAHPAPRQQTGNPPAAPRTATAPAAARPIGPKSQAAGGPGLAPVPPRTLGPVVKAAPAGLPAPAPFTPPVAPRPIAAKVPSRPPAVLAPSAAPPAVAQPRPAAQFFADLDADVNVDIGDLGIVQGAPAHAPDARSVAFYAPPPAEVTTDWPAGICTMAEAEEALRHALTGTADTSKPLHELAVRTLEALSDLERSVLSGHPQPIDPAPIHRAAMMRLRVADGLASAPPPGTVIDSTALSAVMGEIDALLADVTPLLAAAPEELAPALEAIRNSLVREAIDFSETAQRIGPAAPVPEPVAAPVRRRNEPRVISVQSVQEAELEAAEARRGRMAWLVLAVALVVALLYHGWSYLSRPTFTPPSTVAGAPAGSMSGDSLKSGGRFVYSPAGKFDPAEVEKFRADQELKGNKVEEIAPGVLRVAPAGPAGK